ncbi:doublecortin domain-containing protein 1-like isoform X1 [Mytilus californianus]|uniref:doublecortin domain-containing protein 1-like isoform X1 n=1 Tax=Mytilus californianus TaxID=6549 RepID=UPI00224587E2|nr:doublecortin domain-containing protein 1-like isoform X1 [Mytilus californianus]
MSKKKEDQPKIHLPKEQSVQFSRTSTDMVSYEDLLIAQYLEELRKTKGEMRKKKDVPRSPYAQRVSSATEYKYSKRRPMSATYPARPPSGNKPKIDAKFIADPNLWDPATPRERMTITTATTTATSQQIKNRPASAPAKNKGISSRPISATSNLSWFYGRSTRPWSGRSFGSAFSGRKIKSQYKKQPLTIRVVAYKNGSRERFAKIAAPTMKIFLECCTDRLGLPFAARRVFLEGGVEIFDAEDIPIDGEVFVSCGENYKDPLASVKRNILISEGAKWTLSGLLLPDEGRVRTRKAKMSKRMKKLIENNRVRIVVYKNGIATEPIECVADQNNMEDFLCACTAKLNLTSYAKILYDWEGNVISDLNDAPILDDCFQPGSTPIRGPLWVSIGEAFNAIAAYSYIRTMRSVVISRMDDAEKYKGELQCALDGNKDKITMTVILSMKKEEIEAHIEKAEAEIENLNETKQDLQAKLENIQQLQQREKNEGSNFTMGHIKEFKFDHRLVGRKGLRLKVYENGIVEGGMDFYFNLSGAMKGIEGGHDAKQKILQRLLDDLSSNRLLANPVRPKILPVASNIYDQYGNDIKDVFTLEYDQEIWVSFGEPFINPFTWMLQIQFDEAECYDMGDKTLCIRKQLMTDSIHEYSDYNLQNEWDVHIGFPPTYPAKSNEYEKARAVDLASSSEVDSRSHYLQSKKKEDFALYPELVVNHKLKKGQKDFWPMETQSWIISKKGTIYAKCCPQLCLTVSDTRVDVPWSGKNSPLNGFVVTVQKKMSANTYQQWRFNPNGTLTCMAYENLLLTYLQHKFGDEEGYMAPDGVKPGQRIYLVLADPLQKKEKLYQRFALKQERFENLGQWKYSDATNPEFNKLAYSWPCRRDGTLNEDYDWPMEAFIVPNAPPVHKPRKEQQSGMPLRLMAIKNGERDYRFMSPVVGPDLTNMMKDLHKEKDKSKTKSKITQEKDVPVSNSDIVENDIHIHCENMTVRQLEFTMFLDHSTSVLNLPFAARRLFDNKGNEHFSLVNLKRDDLVYISCGESWIDPKLSKEEQQKRFLLSQLSQDVAKIRQYCALRNPEKYVLEIEGNLVPTTRIIVNRQWSKDEEEKEILVTTDTQSVKSSKQLSSKGFEEEEEDLTAHDRAHRLADQRLNNLKWPWERLVNTGNDDDDDDPEAHKYTDKEMYERYKFGDQSERIYSFCNHKPASVPKISRDTLQRFKFEDGYISCAANRELVLGLMEQEGRVRQVLLVKRKPDDINQRWVMKENGEIRSKHSNQTCLTVSMPNNEPFSEDEEGRPLTFSGCPVTLQARKTNKYGKAHQRWHYDAETGFIHSFYADPYDKEITAANKADVCTFSIAGQDNIDQPGYVAEIPLSTGDKQCREYLVCTSCARAMRGRYKINKLQNNVQFSCSMGEAKKLKLQQIGSFKVLNGKVDLSTHEALLSLQDWEHKLRTLRDETNVRTIAKEISAAKSVKTVKILAYKNGEGRLRPGELICGSTIEGILDQCTYRLGLNSAARRIYTEDGTMVMEIEDLIDWAVDNYKTLMAEYLQGKDAKVDDLELEHEPEKQEQETEKLDEQGKNLRERGEGEGQDSQEEVQQDKDSAEVDQQEANKLAKEREMVLSQIQIPGTDTILRYPIEVWISSGKDFVAPEIVESKIENRRKKRVFRSAVSLELDIEKHILRQMKARRYEEMDPGELKPTRSSRQPVVIEGNWQEPSVEEQLKHDTVHKLETHLAEVKKNQKEPTKTIGTSGRLYKQPDTKRVMVYPNGESLERAVYVWGNTLEEILDNSTAKLGMWQKARLIYTMEGKLVTKFQDINKDELLCVSGGKPFTKPQGYRDVIEIKANWTRARKEYGPSATDFTVDAPVNPKVNVDPFGPPALTMPPEETAK